MKKTVRLVAMIVVMALLVSLLTVYAFNTPSASAFTPSISGTVLNGIPEKTNLAALKAVYPTEEIKVFNLSQVQVTDTSVDSRKWIGTGFTVRVGDAASFTDYTVMILGDVDGDGEVTTTDYLRIKAHFKRVLSPKLSGVYFIAADVTGDGVISTTDYIRIKRHFFGLYDLFGSNSQDESSAAESSVSQNSEAGWTSGWV